MPIYDDDEEQRPGMVQLLVTRNNDTLKVYCEKEKLATVLQMQVDDMTTDVLESSCPIVLKGKLQPEAVYMITVDRDNMK